ncbi:MAG: hypothetical protein HQK73_07050 [Desulfamplus sp.]|nr:hypothetical protein [Desulfamplus sp.]
MIKTKFLGNSVFEPTKIKNENELQKIKKKLQAQNEARKETIKELSEEIKSIDDFIARITNDIGVYEQRIKEYPDGYKIKQLESDNETLTSEVNKIRQKIKNFKSDEESSLLLLDTLMEEYNELKNDKIELSKRIQTLNKVIEDLNQEKQEKLPQLKAYDTMLKKAWYEMQETENSMDISLRLWQRKSSYKPVVK